MLCKRIIVKMLKKNNLSDQAYDELVRRIVSGTFPAGRMLQEEKLSSEFGISRTPVREALQRLSAEGLVEQLPRRGYRVSLPDEEALKELYECRTRLELMALNLALGEIPEQEIFVLEKKLKNASGEKNPALSLEADTEMHSLIMDFSGNRYLAALIRQFMMKTAPFRSYRNQKNLEENNEERLQILDAIRERNLKKASRLLKEHILPGNCPGKKSA